MFNLNQAKSLKFKIIKKLQNFISSLKDNKTAILILIAINYFMAIASNIVDWPWLMSVEWYLMPFTPICSLFPLTLGVWFTLYYFKKRIPDWYTTFIFIGIISYGIMSYIYFPLYTNWTGFQWIHIGNMFWVTVYALQSLIIASEIKPIKIYQFTLIVTYYLFKDYTDRYWGTFIDATNPRFPEDMKNFFAICILIIHFSVFTLTAKLAHKNLARAKSTGSNEPKAAYATTTVQQ